MNQILEELYVKPASRKESSRWGAFRRWLAWASRRWSLWFATLSLFTAAWIAAHLYYYNLLVGLEFNVKAAWAQVEAQQQRRFHIQRNLALIVKRYEAHERDVLKDLTKMRSLDLPVPEGLLGGAGAGPAELPGKLQDLLSRIKVIAEEYPQLKLTENLQQLSKTMVDTETTIAEKVMKYNDAVNLYTTVLNQFPARFFAVLCGFDSYDFYAPEKGSLEFQEVPF